MAVVALAAAIYVLGLSAVRWWTDGLQARGVADARASREMLLLGSSVKVAPIVQWDGQVIGDGRPGPVARALLRLLEEDMRKSDRLIDVPY